MNSFFIRAEAAGLGHDEAVALLAEGPVVERTGVAVVADPFDTGADTGPLPF